MKTPQADSSKTILLIIPNLGRGGAQKVFHDQLALYKNYFNTIGCVFNWDGSFESDLQRGIISLDVPAGESVIGKVYYFVRRIVALRRLKQRFKVDVTISHLEGADYINLFSGTRSKIYCWIHGTKRFDRNISGLLGFLRKKILMPYVYRRADKLVTVSDGIKREFINALKVDAENIVVARNGVDISAIKQLASEKTDAGYLQLCERHPVAITHCRLSAQKNIDSLLKLAAIIKKNCAVKFVILGDGELRNALLAQASALRLRVFHMWAPMPWTEDYDLYFMGQQQNPFKFLRSAKIYLLPSLWEGFPLSLCEAMACGLPIMASDCHTGPRELLAFEHNDERPVSVPTETNFGMLMPLPEGAESIDQWATKLATSIGNHEWLTIISGEVQRRADEFDMSVVRSKWLEVIDLK